MERVAGSVAEEHRQASHAKKMQVLYSDAVVPDQVVRFCQGDHMGAFQHMCGEDIQEDTVVADLRQALNRYLLRSDERPTLTRMFTFVACLNGLLLLRLFHENPHDAGDNTFLNKMLLIFSSKPSTTNQGRVKAFAEWMMHPDTGRELRRAALAASLTVPAMALVSKTSPSKTGSNAGVPIIVRIGRRECQTMSLTRLRAIVAAMHLDSMIDIEATVT